VAYLLDARTVEPEKQLSLANGSETTFFLGNSRETNDRTTSVAKEQILNKKQQNINKRMVFSV
jgi:hypothetical protein